MVDVVSQPAKALSGKLRVPSDKSISHRALLLSSIADGESLLHHLLMGEDNRATMAAMQAMGVDITQVDDTTHRVSGVGLWGLSQPADPLNLGNSGTGLRLLTGLLAAQPFESRLVGDESLMGRPMKRIVDPLRKMGARIGMSLEGTPPLHLLPSQSLHGIHYDMPIASAQVKSCLLLAGLYAAGQTEIIEPAPSRDHTERLLKAMGASIECSGNTVVLHPCKKLQSQDLTVPADISSAAFFIVAATIVPKSEIVLMDVGVNPTRTGIITILNDMGADIALENEREFGGEPVADIRVRSSLLKGIEIPEEQVPLAIDEFPIIAIAAACATGKTIIKGAKELRVKESDRIAAMAEGLTRLGISVETYDDGMCIEGGIIQGGEVNSFTDHRIAMSFAIAGAVAKSPVTIHDCKNIETSFPGFVSMTNQLGLNIL